MTYRRSRHVVLAQCPGQGGPLPIFGDVESNSATRMDSLVPDWRDRAVGANLWWNADDWQWQRPHHLQEILDETGCEVVISLGSFVADELGMPRKSVILEVIELTVCERKLRVTRFPHPSGRNRWWNDERRRVESATALREALDA